VQCWHHVPTGLSKACTAITLQQSVHVPQARVGARPASAAMEWGGELNSVDMCVVHSILPVRSVKQKIALFAGTGRRGRKLLVTSANSGIFASIPLGHRNSLMLL
jgi:hypothetical protein